MNWESEQETKDCFLKETTAVRKEYQHQNTRERKDESHMLEVQMLSYKVIRVLSLLIPTQQFHLDAMKHNSVNKTNCTEKIRTLIRILFSTRKFMLREK